MQKIEYKMFYSTNTRIDEQFVFNLMHSLNWISQSVEHFDLTNGARTFLFFPSHRELCRSHEKLQFSAIIVKSTLSVLLLVEDKIVWRAKIKIMTWAEHDSMWQALNPWQN